MNASDTRTLGVVRRFFLLGTLALAASCGNGGPGTSPDGSMGNDSGQMGTSTGGFMLAVTSATSCGTLLNVTISLQNMSVAAPVNVSPTLFSVTLASRVVIESGVPTATDAMACQANEAVATGGTLSCDLTFTLPAGTMPAALNYNDNTGHMATAPIGITGSADPLSNTSWTSTTISPDQMSNGVSSSAWTVHFGESTACTTTAGTGTYSTTGTYSATLVEVWGTTAPENAGCTVTTTVSGGEYIDMFDVMNDSADTLSIEGSVAAFTFTGCAPGVTGRDESALPNNAGFDQYSIAGTTLTFASSSDSGTPYQATWVFQPCTNSMTDPNNCGTCGHVCGAGSTCQAGVCHCGTGSTLCGGQCVNTQSDASNCSACGTACLSGAPCMNGVCGCTGGETRCGSVCTQTQSDNANCGACGHACTSGQTCESGTCVCNTGSSTCNGACVDLTTDPTNCGVCSRSCANGQMCTNGSCVTGLYGTCQTGSTCSGTGALCETMFPGGICSASCTSNTQCGTGQCVSNGTSNECVPSCTPGGLQCDSVGGACFSLGTTPATFACIPSCFPTGTTAPAGEPSCPAGLQCDPYYTVCTATPSRSTLGDNGAPCTDSTQCRSGSCIPETDSTGAPTGYLGGYCTTFARLPAQSAYVMGQPMPQSNCPLGSAAYPFTGSNEGDSINCLKTCMTAADCPSIGGMPAYTCDHLMTSTGQPYLSNGACLPMDCSMSGMTCATGHACVAQAAGGSLCQ